METKCLPTYQTALDELVELSSCGWVIRPDDDTPRAEVAYLAARKWNGVEKFLRLVWYPFGRPLDPKWSLPSALPGFLALFGEHVTHRLYISDDPSGRRFGFACYCLEPAGRSTVFRLGMEHATDLGEVFFRARSEALEQNLKALLSDA